MSHMEDQPAAQSSVPLSDAFFTGRASSDSGVMETLRAETEAERSEWLIQAEHMAPDLSQDEADYVRALLEESHPQMSDEEVCDNLDLRSELASLIRITSLLKAKVMTPSGALRNKVDVVDLKNTATSMIALTKQVKEMREGIYGQERIKSIERATAAAMATMGSKAQQQFLETLQAELEKTDG